MSAITGPNNITNGLILYVDAANPNSYTPGSSMWYDLSRNNPGLILAGTSYTSGSSGAVYSSGTGSFTNIVTPGGNNTTQITWYYWRGTNAIKLLHSLGNSGTNGIGLLQHDGSGSGIGNKIGVLYGGISYNAINTGTRFVTLQANVWTQVAVTRDTTTTTLYQNGAILGTTTNTPGQNTQTWSGSFGLEAPGDYATLQIYNRALSAAEIAQNFNSQRFRFGI